VAEKFRRLISGEGVGFWVSEFVQVHVWYSSFPNLSPWSGCPEIRLHEGIAEQFMANQELRGMMLDAMMRKYYQRARGKIRVG
jgi:hypothetical protein